jgi:hypothetical protein
MCSPTLCMARADRARHTGAAMRRGDIRVLGRASRGCPQSPREPGGLAMVDHPLAGPTAKALQGLLMTGPKMLPGLRHGTRDRPQAAVAQHHAQDAQTAVGGPPRDRAAGAPVDLRPRTGGQGEGEQSGLTCGANRAPRGCDEGVAPRTAMRAHALEDLGGARRLWVEPLDPLRRARSECAGPRTGLARSHALLAAPRGDGAGIARHGVGTRRAGEPRRLRQSFALTNTVRIDPDHPAQMRAHTAFMSTGSSSAAPVEALLGALMGSVSRGKTWESGW